jgi:hypothetical protein
MAITVASAIARSIQQSVVSTNSDRWSPDLKSLEGSMADCRTLTADGFTGPWAARSSPRHGRDNKADAG